MKNLSNVNNEKDFSSRSLIETERILKSIDPSVESLIWRLSRAEALSGYWNANARDQRTMAIHNACDALMELHKVITKSM